MVRAVRIPHRLLKPGMFIGGMVYHQIHNQAHAAAVQA